jgi:cell division protein FtsW
MSSFSRTDVSVLGRWWWTVDRWMLAGLVALAGAGCLLTLAASPAVAQRLHLPPFHFVYRQLFYLTIAGFVLVATSLLTPRQVRRLSLLMLPACLLMMAMTLNYGQEIKGAHRWLSIGPVSIQASEFMKPAFTVVVAWLFAEQKHGTLPGNLLATGLLAVTLVLLALEPDIGQSALVVIVWCGLFFIAGLPIAIVGALVGMAGGGLYLAYMFIPHVTSRVDRFFNPESGDTFQVDTAMAAFAHGGLFGSGPGEGVVKRILPDAHTDYIFAVAGEEYGVIACLLLLGLFAFIVLRALSRAFAENDLFVQLAISGLTVLFGIQAVINMGVNLNILPSKGMTLPFISYGGSSLIALALTMGMLLALTRKRRGFALEDVE